MPEDDAREVARELFDDLLNESPGADTLRSVFFDLYTSDATGEPIPVYGKESTEGFGKFECSFWPLSAVERIVNESRKHVSDIVITEKRPDGSSARVTLGETLDAAGLESYAREMAYNAAHALLSSLTFHLQTALQDNFNEAVLFGSVAVRRLLSARLHSQGTIKAAKIASRDDTDALIDRAAEQRRARLRRLIEKGPYTVAPKVGAPPKLTDAGVREVLLTHGKITKEQAAELLDCDPRTLTNWARGTRWKTWTKARAQILAELKTGKN